MSNVPNLAYNPDDPHGFYEDGHHGHVIVPWQILLGVLLILLGFTALTVFQAQFEKFAFNSWGWSFPGWVNVVLAMGIACIKGTLVVLFFMQLRYDKGINIILFLFTLMAVWFFIMFTAIDLKNRDTITEWRAGEITAGGTGVGFGGNGFAVRRKDIKTKTGSMLDKVKENYIAEFGIEQYERALLAAHHTDHEEAEVSDAWASRTRDGLTPGLFSSGVWEHLDDGHGDAGHEAEVSHESGAPADESPTEDAGGH